MQTLSPEKLEFGYMHDETCMMVMRAIHRRQSTGSGVELDLKRKLLKISFTTHISDPRTTSGRLKAGLTKQAPEQWNVLHEYKFEIRLSQLSVMNLGFGSDGAEGTITFTLKTPPAFYRKAPGSGRSSEGSRAQRDWRHAELWLRQTDIVYDPVSHGEGPLSLEKSNAFIDLGKPRLKIRSSHWLNVFMQVDGSLIESRSDPSTAGRGRCGKRSSTTCGSSI